MARRPETQRESATFALICGIAIVAVLYLAQEILLPFALAVLISFLLAPVVRRLEKRKVPRIPAVLLVVAIFTASWATLSCVVIQQVYELAVRLPEYKENILNKADSLRSGAGDEVMKRFTGTLEDMRAYLTREEGKSAEKSPEDPPKEQSIGEGVAKALGLQTGADDQDAVKADGANPDSKKEPLKVQVVDDLSAMQIARNVVGPILGPLGTAAIVLVFVIFMLLEREDLRNRLIQLCGSKNLTETTHALDEAGKRVSRYLVMQLIINVLYGIVIAIGLFFIGLPNASLWGILTTVLRFIPYVGPWIAAAVPMALSLAVFDGWTLPLLVLALFVVNELISNNVLEPWLYGASTGMSTIGVLVSSVFWAWLWGPVGLIMATPLTVCVMVLGKHLPQVAFLNTLLSDQESLPPESRFYQRLLAMDPDEAQELVDDYLKQHSVMELYDSVLIPALRLAEEDRHTGQHDEDRQAFIVQTMRELIDDLGARASEQPVEIQEQADGVAARRQISIVCLPARDQADELVAMMFSQMLELHGFQSHTVSKRALASEMVAEVENAGAHIVCVSALPPYAATHARYLCKRLRPKFPRMPILVGLWQSQGTSKKSQDRLRAIGVDHFVTTLQDATDQALNLAMSQRLIQPDELEKSKPEEIAGDTTGVDIDTLENSKKSGQFAAALTLPLQSTAREAKTEQVPTKKSGKRPAK
ncbi:MAG: AI-2E family transporter [Planctomycetota bacterium]|nr:AI-2E family transporter [Planctomycetota bacterium]